MDEIRNVLPIGSLRDKQVLSLQTGNRLGEVLDFYIDPINGRVLGLSLVANEFGQLALPYEAIHSFGHDAVMAISESALLPIEEAAFSNYPRSGDLIGTNMITVSGNLLGQIRNVFVTMQPPPTVVYSIGDSLLDRLLGREFYVLASAGHAFSDDGERLVVPDDTADKGAKSIGALFDPDPDAPEAVAEIHTPPREETWVPNVVVETWAPDSSDDTVVILQDDETVVRLRPDLKTGEQTS